ncbi:MAG TPA: polyribonucleotide nucleotidyltransferase [Anaerolinea thermolimosa]|uniref:Polyribonucleotide nucleotidyltransferase n=1 Tax=Anaerolinea thermolimosa TaxID=229919 RepID=A0A3D1JGG7_9CHLR|nr:polyribonucleotide nucleotidyltransferase [Anaerolinea thermolimosa]GAP05826.1 polyribonucleotide nucleotidyltransferase [Anaerolinea thermolimosa]HCE17612.1 polyribonucleotide nucleotidyltransferase [Anaerolinea thermolimosa]
MKPESKQFTAMVGGRPVIFETGKLASLAGGAVTVRLGDSMVFAAATMSPEPKENVDFFPLTVEYEERMYAGGRIPGSFYRREGRPSTEAILTARLTDRPIRPLFNKEMRNEVQVIMFSLSADQENPLDILCINAASAALMISDIPWGGPVGGVRVARVHGQFIANPTFSQMEQSDLDLRIAGTRDAILMVECGANEVAEEDMVAAIQFGHQAIQSLVEAQEKMAAEVGKPKREVPLFTLDPALSEQVYQRAAPALEAALEQPHDKTQLASEVEELEKQIISEFAGEDETLVDSVKTAFEEAYKKVVRTRILERGIRPDHRTPEEIRPIWCEVDISPRAHGSGLFTRGETQVLTLATLGTPKEAQELDSLTPESIKRYMHHYNFPPYSTGEVKPLRGSSRREIGHGALAERALEPVIPDESVFPYTLRLVSEVLSSNGSTSMASVCGSTLALMDTGVPIKAPVAGIAMGLIKEGDRYVILSDIQGLEDHLGDMDFKVAGTSLGITALQMDIKIKGITPEIMSQALAQARKGRLEILDKMLAVIPQPRPSLKPHVPRITIVKIPIDKIGAIIGPGGKYIRALQEETNTKIDIEDDGTVYIAATDSLSEMAAREKIEAITEIPQIGRIYTGKVVRVTDFGAFVEILPNVDGMVHISQLDTERVNKVEDVVNVGDEVTVMVTNIDPEGKIRLSRQAVLEGWTAEEALERDRGGRSSSGGRSGAPRGSGDRNGSSRSSGGRSDRDRGGRSGDRGPRRN